MGQSEMTAFKSDGSPKIRTLMSTERYLQLLLPPGSELNGRDSTQLHVDMNIVHNHSQFSHQVYGL